MAGSMVKIDQTSRLFALLWISLSVLLSLSMWFSASVVQSQIEKAWGVGKGWDFWIASSVQLGFIAGSLISSLLMLPDRMNPRKLFALSAMLGAFVNGAIIFVHHAGFGLLLRFITGLTLAGVYPVGVKLLSQWFQNKRGLSMGILIGAFTIGSALPHYAASLIGGMNWRSVILTSSVLSLLASFLVRWVLPDAPHLTASVSKISFGKLKEILKNRGIMYTNYGYFGHMWELYAMWAWLSIFLNNSFSLSLNKTDLSMVVELYSFLAIGVFGAMGCIVGGMLAEKFGKANLSAGSMLISGMCSILICFSFGKTIWLTVLIAMVWGMSIIADSAQFSAAVTEYCEPEYVGTALTFQIAVGFLISVISINLIPVLASSFGWKWVFTVLSIGPFFGVISMIKLNRWRGVNSDEISNDHY